MNRTEKAESVASLKEVFKASKVVVVAHYSGLTVAQMQTLRKQMKQAGAQVKVAKNRLAKIALDGSDAASIAPLLKGPTLIAYSERSGSGTQGRHRLRQGERAVRHPRRSDGQDRPGRERREAARFAAVAR